MCAKATATLLALGIFFFGSPAVGSELGFSNNTLADFSAISGEPFIRVGPDDEIFVSTPFGLSTTVSLLWKSVDGGRSFIPLGTPILRDAVTGAGGGDTHLDFDHAGRLYYVDLSGACVTAAVSEDRGESFPPERTNQLTCVGTSDPGAVGDDRQWVAALGDGIGYMTARNLLISAGDNFHLFKTRDGGLTWDGGRTIGTVTQSGPLQVDKTRRTVTVDGSEREAILLYQVFYRPNTTLRVFRIIDLDDGSPPIVSDLPIATPGGTVNNVFPLLTIGRDGNLYAAWSQSATTIFMATSQDRGDSWSAPVRVSPPEMTGANVMPWIVAGDAGRVDVVWYNTPGSNTSGSNSPWHIFMAQSLDALAPSPTFTTARVSETVIHRGEICLRGLSCDLPVIPVINPQGPGDRSFLEFPSIDVDSRGAAVITYNDNTNQAAGAGESGGAYVMVARQITGPSLYADVGMVEGDPGAVTIVRPADGEQVDLPFMARGTHTLHPATFDRDEADDARFPDHGLVIGDPIPALDIREVALADDGERITATLTVADLTPAALAAAPVLSGGDGVLYLGQWDFEDFVYWVAAEVRGTTPVFQTGTLGILRSATSKKFITYNPDLTASLEVEGSIAQAAPGTVTLHLPRGVAGDPAADAPFFSVTAYTLSERGPLVPVGVENTADPTSLPVQVDAAGPFTYVVGGGQRLAGVVEAAVDDPDLAAPRLATAGLDGTWELELRAAELAAGTHTLYARQLVTGRDPSPIAAVAFSVAGGPQVACIEDDDTRIAYSNGWHLVAHEQASDGHFRYHTGSSPQGGLTLDFEVAGGSGSVELRYATSLKGGTANIVLDDVIRGTLDFHGAAGSNRDPQFGASAHFDGLEAGVHTLELRELDGPVFVDAICLESAVSAAQPAAGPGETSAGMQTVAADGDVTQALSLPAGTLALAATVESSLAAPIGLALVDPGGSVLATAGDAWGSAVLEVPVAEAGLYTLHVLNLGLDAVEVWTLATPLVAREGASVP